MKELDFLCQKEIKVDVKKELLKIKDKVDTISINYEQLNQD